MTLGELKELFVLAGCTRLYAKPLSENDNSKNQIYFAGAVEALNVFPSRQVFAQNTSRGPSFKALLNFGWLLDNGSVAPAPRAQFILYSQYPEVRFSGFLSGCDNAPGELMMDRQRARKAGATMLRKLGGRVLFLGTTRDRRVIGYAASGDSVVAAEFGATSFQPAFGVLFEIPLPNVADEITARAQLLLALRRINQKDWIDSKQLDRDGIVKPCSAQNCGGFTLEAELGIPKNSEAEPDFLGWEVKQYAVDDFDRIESSKAITLMTPEPSGGFYCNNTIEAFIRRFGYADKKGREDRMNFGGRHFVGRICKATSLTMEISGFDLSTGKITDANGQIALVSNAGEVAASWSFIKMFEHWSRKHTKAVYVPSQRQEKPTRQYRYGHKVRLAQRTDSLRLLRAFAVGSVYYDPGIKLEEISSGAPTHKKRSQFRVASKDITALYETVETVAV
jgi:MvaI/BcnI restriction endonuclease family